MGTDSAKKNIVWFCTDQQRFNTISGMGYKEVPTPNLDRLIEEGVGFQYAYTQCPVCSPSRASFLTGRYPRSTKVSYNGNDDFSRDETLVTKRLADSGYTCGLTGKLHLTAAMRAEETRTDDGYSFYQWSHHPHDDWAYGVNRYQDWLKDHGVKWENIYGGRYLSMGIYPPVPTPGFTGEEVGVPAQYHQTTWCVDETIRFIEETGDKPWLISINPFDPHPPLDPPREYKDRMDPASLSMPLYREGEHDNKPPHYLKDYIRGGQEGSYDSVIGMTDEHQLELRRDYYAQILLIDDQVGRLMHYLDENGLREDTIFIFTSYHGEMNGDHGLHWKGAYFYEEMVRVPLIFSCPGLIQHGKTSNALVDLVDIAPTLLELNGYPIPQAMQGKSLAGLLTGKSDLHHHKEAVYCEYYAAIPRTHEEVMATMYRDKRFKVVVYHGMPYGELYDMQLDPNQFNNLWDNPKYRDVKHEMIKRDFDRAILCNRDLSLGTRFDF
ncbi:MAG: sulfatase-like hydrolase/transferase [Planctomycetaceae bacterium]|nr:sulfatase-like hydrolase/transferase [Planctomycetaceae bacterium]